ncbi:uncharacterized protein K460DRAFT_363448 [Cucurbitaria berberidis CBS 394.84]|uniref:Uncharacterized protein n=1 Tax=Cucurbitaria berberidis CBS 394.84 TaxID=1168544 RepID=A0A9P4GLF9_9PLEO|nr:uncharacterized protein K460DRAFT_363448 [Cucurbitaria berberidis CBS 394.84]KAF1847359.1 hypothetical protein K460DRAFT_363448 [Cucurbitaria berberidis CBS 394.84]
MVVQGNATCLLYIFHGREARRQRNTSLFTELPSRFVKLGEKRLMRPHLVIFRMLLSILCFRHCIELVRKNRHLPSGDSTHKLLGITKRQQRASPRYQVSGNVVPSLMTYKDVGFSVRCISEHLIATLSTFPGLSSKIFASIQWTLPQCTGLYKASPGITSYPSVSGSRSYIAKIVRYVHVTKYSGAVRSQMNHLYLVLESRNKLVSSSCHFLI